MCIETHIIRGHLFFTLSIETVEFRPVNNAAVLHSQYTRLVLLQMETERLLLALCTLELSCTGMF